MDEEQKPKKKTITFDFDRIGFDEMIDIISLTMADSSHTNADMAKALLVMRKAIVSSSEPLTGSDVFAAFMQFVDAVMGGAPTQKN